MAAGIDAPDGWTHRSGYRLDADGKRIAYDGPGGERATVEAVVSEYDDDPMEYCVVVGDAPPSVYGAKDDAIEAVTAAMREV